MSNLFTIQKIYSKLYNILCAGIHRDVIIKEWCKYKTLNISRTEHDSSME